MNSINYNIFDIKMTYRFLTEQMNILFFNRANEYFIKIHQIK